jgi:hypothetical protein
MDDVEKLRSLAEEMLAICEDAEQMFGWFHWESSDRKDKRELLARVREARDRGLAAGITPAPRPRDWWNGTWREAQQLNRFNKE